ncbi:MAG: Unknown protein [uncultured Aureispira sp.]|uniref:Uncharacterized protein n=1 Tax=uncultured Aureispira sp. TaxID=1331704 RepID=A0A6S6S9U8_9BACT|nr:MAG: Unknown protein [uncultured Aureispira sp.]
MPKNSSFILGNCSEPIAASKHATVQENKYFQYRSQPKIGLDLTL